MANYKWAWEVESRESDGTMHVFNTKFVSKEAARHFIDMAYEGGEAPDTTFSTRRCRVSSDYFDGWLTVGRDIS